MVYFIILCSLQLCRDKFSFRFVREKNDCSRRSDKGLRGILERLVNIPAKMLRLQTVAAVGRLYKLLKLGAC